jgi:hypothetical protein
VGAGITEPVVRPMVGGAWVYRHREPAAEVVLQTVVVQTRRELTLEIGLEIVAVQRRREPPRARTPALALPRSGDAL